MITTVEELCNLPELTEILDANGTPYILLSSGRPTTNPNWIAWKSGGAFFHSDQIALPATTITGSAA